MVYQYGSRERKERVHTWARSASAASCPIADESFDEAISADGMVSVWMRSINDVSFGEVAKGS